MLEVDALGGLGLSGLDGRLQGLEVLVSDLDLVDLLLDLEGSVDEVEDVLGEVVGVLDKEAGVDECGIVEVLDEFGAALIGLFLGQQKGTSTILFSSWMMGA